MEMTIKVNWEPSLLLMLHQRCVCCASCWWPESCRWWGSRHCTEVGGRGGNKGVCLEERLGEEKRSGQVVWEVITVFKESLYHRVKVISQKNNKHRRNKGKSGTISNCVQLCDALLALLSWLYCICLSFLCSCGGSSDKCMSLWNNLKGSNLCN